jgi:hypothetical protein
LGVGENNKKEGTIKKPTKTERRKKKGVDNQERPVKGREG